MSIISGALRAALSALVWAMALTALPAPTRAAEEPFKQVQLDDKLVKGFIAAQQDMADYHQKSGAPTSDKPNPKVQADLDALSKKHGFANFAEFDDIAFNISMVMGGLDPQSGVFTDPITAIKKEIDEIKADASIPEKDKKQMLDELAEALKNTPPMKFPGNVDIVKRFRADIEKVLQ
jgi:hypothetical protein